MLEKTWKLGRGSKKSSGYTYQGFDNDRLFKASSGYIPAPDCQDCDAAGEVQRDPRDTTDLKCPLQDYCIRHHAC